MAHYQSSNSRYFLLYFLHLWIYFLFFKLPICFSDVNMLLEAKLQQFVSFYFDQVYNRDISIAVLRTNIAKRKEEHDAYLSKKGKSTKKFPEGKVSASVAEDRSTTQHEKANGVTEVKENGDTEVQKHQFIGKTNNCSDGFLIVPSFKGPQELKPPRVLEVSHNLEFIFSWMFLVKVFIIQPNEIWSTSQHSATKRKGKPACVVFY